MLRTRVMPCLLLDDGSLIKTERFKNPRYVGDPVNAVRIYNQMEVDELIVLDVNASARGTGIDFDLLEKLASECFMPVTYGGGVKTVDDFRKLYSLGIEKVSVCASAVENPRLITQAAEIFGNQSVVVTMDVKRNWLKRYRATTRRGKTDAGMGPVEFARRVQELGAGELVVNSVDRDGTWAGYDLELLREVTSAVSIPVIACGGAGELTHLKDAVDKAGASALAIGSMAVFQAKGLGVLIKFPQQSQLEALFQ